MTTFSKSNSPETVRLSDSDDAAYHVSNATASVGIIRAAGPPRLVVTFERRTVPEIEQAPPRKRR